MAPDTVSVLTDTLFVVQVSENSAWPAHWLALVGVIVGAGLTGTIQIALRMISQKDEREARVRQEQLDHEIRARQETIDVVASFLRSSTDALGRLHSKEKVGKGMGIMLTDLNKIYLLCPPKLGEKARGVYNYIAASSWKTKNLIEGYHKVSDELILITREETSTA